MDDNILTLITMLDISRRNVERALKANNFYSAGFLAGEMAKEAEALAKACAKAGAARNKANTKKLATKGAQA